MNRKISPCRKFITTPIFKCNFTESARGEDPTSAFELEMSKAAVT